MNANLLLIHQGALGDVVATFPAIIRLKRYFRQIDAICQNQIGKMACALGVIDQSYPLEGAAFASLYSDSASSGMEKILKAYHEIILFSYSEELEGTVSRSSGKEAHCITPRPDVHQRVHVTEHILSNLVRCGLLKPEDAETIGLAGFSNPAIALKESEAIALKESEAATESEATGLKESGRILIHPGSGSRRKNWPVPNFIEVERHLRSAGMKSEFILGPAEYFLAEFLDQARVVRRFSDLTELVSSLRNAGGFIGNDSGVSHLAAFMGVPTVAIFGPSDPARWQPVGSSVKVIRPGDLDCEPCFEITKTNCDSAECLRRITPEMVVRTIMSED